jgi:hypothetical protein
MPPLRSEAVLNVSELKVCAALLHERTFSLKLSGDQVYYTACS